jgi:hypothetical protein
MSWGVGAFGYAPAVRKMLREHMAAAKPCPEIEEQIRQGAAALLDATLATYSPETVVKVDCRGSLCMESWENEKGITQNLILVIEPVHNFVCPDGVKHG